MAEKSNYGGIASDSTSMFDDGGGSILNGVKEFVTAVVTVNFPANLVASGKIIRDGLTHSVTGDLEIKSGTLHDYQGFANDKAEFGVKGHRAAMVSGLD